MGSRNEGSWLVAITIVGQRERLRVGDAFGAAGPLAQRDPSRYLSTKMNTRATAGRAPTADLDREQSRALKLWVVLARAYSAIARHAEADVARDGLTAAEFAILDALFAKGRLRTGELQQTVLVTSGGTTYLVDRLATRGLVKRADCPEDRRVRYVELTPKGERLMEEMFPRHAKVITEALAGLGATEQQEATRLLKSLGKYAADVQGIQGTD